MNLETLKDLINQFLKSFPSNGIILNQIIEQMRKIDTGEVMEEFIKDIDESIERISKLNNDLIKSNYIKNFLKLINRLIKEDLSINYTLLLENLNSIATYDNTLRLYLSEFYLSSDNEQILYHLLDLLNKIRDLLSVSDICKKFKEYKNPNFFIYLIKSIDNFLKIHKSTEGLREKEQIWINYQNALSYSFGNYPEQQEDYFDLIIDKLINPDYSDFLKKIIIQLGVQSENKNPKIVINRLIEISEKLNAE